MNSPVHLFLSVQNQQPHELRSWNQRNSGSCFLKGQKQLAICQWMFCQWTNQPIKRRLWYSTCSGRGEKDEEQSDSLYSVHKESWALHDDPLQFDTGPKKDHLTRPVSTDWLLYSVMWCDVWPNTLICICIVFLHHDSHIEAVVWGRGSYFY